MLPDLVKEAIEKSLHKSLFSWHDIKTVECSQCGKKSQRKFMWFNPKTGDVRCDNCFIKYINTYEKRISLATKINYYVFGDPYKNYRIITNDYFKGNSLVGLVIT